jgi:hypothetical protein
MGLETTNDCANEGEKQITALLSDHSPPSNADVKSTWLNAPAPHTPTWHNA